MTTRADLTIIEHAYAVGRATWDQVREATKACYCRRPCVRCGAPADGQRLSDDAALCATCAADALEETGL